MTSMLSLRKIAAACALTLFFGTANTHAQTGAFTLGDWPTTDAALKPVYVKAIMEQASTHKVSFSKDVNFYVTELDAFYRLAHTNNYRPYLLTPVAQNLATIAVLHCDWHNGVPAWEFAQKFLGAKQLELLTAHYPDAITKLQRNCVEPDENRE
jgi:hypothetical protein